jgi:hypothetical protein
MAKRRKKTYRCAVCKGVFIKVSTDAEARAEFESENPHLADMPKEQMEVLCDDCFVLFKRWLDHLPPAERERMEREGLAAL